MNYEEWYLKQVQIVVAKNRFAPYANKSYYDLAKSIKNSLKRQRILPQNNIEFERKINFGVLKHTKLSLAKIVEITKFYYRSLEVDYDEFHKEFKSHRYFYNFGYMKSGQNDIISYKQWFYNEFSKAHNECNVLFKQNLKDIKNQEH